LTKPVLEVESKIEPKEMKLNEKIRKIRKEKGLTLLEFHQKLKEIFGEKALEYNSLARIEQGKTKPRISSLTQICIGLGVSLRELKEGLEEGFELVDIVKKNKRIDKFTYNPQAYMEILSPLKRNFLCGELVLEPGAKTPTEQDPIEERKYEKLVYCLKGEITCHITQKIYTLKRGDCLSFESSLPHYFENKTSKKTISLIIQNPRHI